MRLATRHGVHHEMAERRRGLRLSCCVAALAGALALAVPQAFAGTLSTAQAGDAQAPPPGALYKDGPSGRYLLGGTWLFRYDDGVGFAKRFEDSTSLSGWTQVTVPNAWNAGNQTAAGYAAQTAWYRKDFLLPSANPQDTWIVRFESVNNTAEIWLNGHKLETHTGAFLAFEVVLPAADLHLRGTNRLVLRVSDEHTKIGLPPLNGTGSSATAGGWWNYGGLLREVYLRRVDRIDFASVLVLPHLSCATCSAQISYSAVLHNYDSQAERVSVNTSYGGQPDSLGSKTIPPGGSRTFTGEITVVNPTLWSPANPYLYDATLTASLAPAGGVVQTYFVESGIRSINVIGGHLYLNYQPLHFRGVGWVEDSPTEGSALTDDERTQLMDDVKQLGATVIRFQYPISPYIEQLADEMGVMLWSEIPVYQAPIAELPAITPIAKRWQRENILENGSHPSIIIWSIANELSSNVGTQESAYFKALVATAHALDPTRPVAIAYQGDPTVSCQSGYASLQVLGINDYFGWYTGVDGNIADRELLGPYLAQEHACYPNQALVVSEFGAEGDVDGPTDERGTYEFQDDWINYQLGVFAQDPWLSGAMYWALQDFLVWPGWTGDNPFPAPPVFHKGLLSFTGTPKPAFSVVQQLYDATDQVG